MPLEKGSSSEAVGSNISELEKNGHPPAQSVAIALKEAGKSKADADELKAPYAAGILFVAGSKILLVKRSADSEDHPGEWAFPGGKIEVGETAEEAAIRECKEELGHVVDLPIKQVSDKEGFITFRGDCEVFKPTLNHEHDGFVWVEPTALPSPILPNAQSVINDVVLGTEGIYRTETDVAKAVMVGDSPSPTRFGNFWLFNIRVTGTGVSYRDKLSEFVFRDPKYYLNDEFLQRCNGLPVVWLHPETDILNSKEFSDRVVGSIVLPYIKDQDVWAVAQIRDASAAEIMSTRITSTSPGVAFRDSDGNIEKQLGNGETLLIEGKPSLLDHLAICEQGVWDKGGEPQGVISDIKGAVNMSEKETRADAETDKLDKILSAMDALHKRMDLMEVKPEAEAKKDSGHDDHPCDMPIPVAAKDAEKDKSDFGKKDAEMMDDEARKDEMPTDPLMSVSDKKDAKKDEDKDMEKKAEIKGIEAEALKKAAADSASELANLRAKIRDMERQLPKQLSDRDYSMMADAQAKADKVFSAFGDAAPRALNGEDLLAYRKRLAKGLKKHSDQWKNVELSNLDESVFDIAESKIYTDSMEAALHPSESDGGGLREVIERQRGGHEISTFYGKPSAWMNSFRTPRLRGRLILEKK